jgi:hypothetical protein
MVCASCLAAAGPPGIAVAAVGTVGYGAYKYTSSKKKIKKGKKKTIKKSKGKKGGAKKFKKGEVVNFVLNTGANKNMKFVRNVSPNRVTLKFLNKKGTMNVDINRVKKIPKNIANTKKRQKTRREALIRKKRGIKTKSTTKSSTLELPNSKSNSGPKSPEAPPPWPHVNRASPDNIDNLLKDMKI